MSAKAPAFQWYAADYLADERVMLLSLTAEGAYTRLLSLCWREGSIPANQALLAAMCKNADPKIIKEVVPLFTREGAPPGRLIHKRLEEERAKHEEFRQRQAAKGAKGGRPRKPDEKPEKPTALPGLSSGLTGEKPDESSSTSTLSSIPSDDGSAGRQAGEVEKSRLQVTKSNLREAPADGAPVFTRTGFREFLKSIGYGHVDIGTYLLQIQREAEKLPPRLNATPPGSKAKSWEGFIQNWLNNDRLNNCLLLPEGQQPAAGGTQRHAVTPTPTAAPYDINKVAAEQHNQVII